MRTNVTNIPGIGYAFWDKSLLEIALTHSSRINEHPSSGHEHNERLEFLGDAVLELCVSEILYRILPNVREGDMTRLRSNLVNTTTMAELARLSGVRDHILLGAGEEAQGGRDRDPLLADAMEAVIGAAYLDGGLAAAQQVIGHLYAGRWPKADSAHQVQVKDNKTLLQEATQRLQGSAKGLPSYTSRGACGPEHAPVFTSEVTLPDGRTFVGTGSTRRASEQEAARKALAGL